MLVRRFEFQKDPGNYIFLSFITKQIEKKPKEQPEDEKKKQEPLIQEEEDIENDDDNYDED